MEAIIKTNNQKTFQALLQFLQSLNIEVLIKQENSTIKQSKKRRDNRKISSLPANNILSKLAGMYNSGITSGSVNHDKELYSE